MSSECLPCEAFHRYAIREAKMTKATFPFLTVESLETNGDSLLSWLGTLWPQAATEIAIVRTLLPQLNKVPFVRGMVQHAVDWFNGLTGAQPLAS